MNDSTTITTISSYALSLGGLIAAIDWEKLIYLSLALATFAVNWYFRRRQDKRDELRLRATLKAQAKANEES